MRIRSVSLLLALIAAVATVALAITFGTALMTAVVSGIQRTPKAAMIGVWVAILGGLAAAFICTLGRGRSK